MSSFDNHCNAIFYNFSTYCARIREHAHSERLSDFLNKIFVKCQQAMWEHFGE
jgi:hypothetical protein